MFYYFNSEMKYWEKPAPSTLNEATWDYIQQAAQDGTASELWSVGDRKEIILNGTCRERTFNDYKVYAYILGFNHNAELEGNNTITFQIGFNDLTDGVPIALTNWTTADVYLNYNSGFKMNNTATSAGGWNGSFMRTTIVPEFISCLPSDLQSVLKAVNKYTDNVGNGSKEAANVTATQDKVFLLAEYEIFGARAYANQYEQNKQAQYDYYKNKTANDRIMYNDQRADTSIWLRERSPYYGDQSSFCVVRNNGSGSAGSSIYSLGFAPAFVVG